MKKILWFLLGFILVFIGWAFIGPKEFNVVKEIVINKPSGQVFNFVKFLKNQDQFSTWARKDPQMKKGFQGKDGEVGAVATWDGNKEVGQGEQEIKSVIPGKIEFELRFKKPMESQANAFISTEAISANQTRVKWGFSGKMPVPFNLMLTFSGADSMGGKDLAQGLDNLKELLEKK